MSLPALLGLLGTLAAAAPPPEAALFPGMIDVARDGAALTLRPAAGQTLTLTPVRYTPPAGRSTPVGMRRCGVVLRVAGRAPIAVETLGIGNSEAVTCGGLLAAGTVPPARGGRPRIALVYRAFSPNFASRAPVILRRDGAQRWSVDDDLSLRLGQSLDPITLPAIRRALRR